MPPAPFNPLRLHFNGEPTHWEKLGLMMVPKGPGLPRGGLLVQVKEWAYASPAARAADLASGSPRGPRLPKRWWTVMRSDPVVWDILEPLANHGRAHWGLAAWRPVEPSRWDPKGADPISAAATRHLRFTYHVPDAINHVVQKVLFSTRLSWDPHTRDSREELITTLVLGHVSSAANQPWGGGHGHAHPKFIHQEESDLGEDPRQVLRLLVKKILLKQLPLGRLHTEDSTLFGPAITL